MGKEKKKEIGVLGGGRQLLRIDYSGVYDLNALLQTIKGFFLEKKYVIIDEEHTESVKPDGRGIKIVMKPFRDIDEYVKFQIAVELLIWRSLDVVMEEASGKKIRKQKGDIEFRFKATMIKNYKKTFAENKLSELMRQTYEKYIIKKRLLDYEDKLYNEAQDLVSRIKRTLNLHSR